MKAERERVMELEGALGSANETAKVTFPLMFSHALSFSRSSLTFL